MRSSRGCCSSVVAWAGCSTATASGARAAPDPRPGPSRALALTPRRACPPPPPGPPPRPGPAPPPPPTPWAHLGACRYVPSVVRVGPNVKETLHDVSLDTLAKRRQADSLDSSLSYDAAKMAVLNEASIVCTTLSCATRNTHLTPPTHIYTYAYANACVYVMHTHMHMHMHMHMHIPPRGPSPQP
jgi:hypothetical protein